MGMGLVDIFRYATVLRDIGFGLVSSIFAGVTILILSIFMVASGPRWIENFIRMQRPEHAERIERTLRKIANAVGNYVGGALLQATIAGLSAFIVLIPVQTLAVKFNWKLKEKMPIGPSQM